MTVFSQRISELPSEPCGEVTVGGKAIPVYMGVIGRIASTGFGNILDASRNEHPFTFDAIAHYRGQSAQSLDHAFGLAEGQGVNFAIVNDRVVFVQPVTQSHPSTSSAPEPLSDSRP